MNLAPVKRAFLAMPFLHQALLVGVVLLLLVSAIGGTFGWLSASADARAARKEAQAAIKDGKEHQAKAEQLQEQVTYLEGKIDEVSKRATELDTQLDAARTATSGARADYDAARTVKRAGTTVDQLCAELAAAGRPCQ